MQKEKFLHLSDQSGVEINYVFEEKSSAGLPVMVFLHEGLGSLAQWKEFPNKVQEKVKLPVLIYDRVGHGKSSPITKKRTAQYLHEEAWNVLPQILSKLNIQKVILIGHSDGGSIALLFAARYPEKVKAVITVAAHVFVEEISLTGIESTVQVFENNEKLKKGLSKYHGNKTTNLFYAWADTWLSEAFRNWNLEEYLPEVKAPLLVIQGTEDEYGTEAQVNKITRGVSGPAEKLMIPECGHAPHHQQSDIVENAILEFILKNEHVIFH
jgi:pimeloyl-ACP methyl ester carboxylesterase